MKTWLSFGLSFLVLVSVASASDISQPGVVPPMVPTPPPSDKAVCILRVFTHESYELSLSKDNNSFVLGQQRKDGIDSFNKIVSAAERLINLRVCSELKIVAGRE